MLCNRRNVMVPVAWHCWNQKPSTSINVLRQFFFLLLCLSLLHSVIVAVFSHSTFCVSSAFIYRMLTNGNKILTRSNSVVFSSVFFFRFLAKNQRKIIRAHVHMNGNCNCELKFSGKRPTLETWNEGDFFFGMKKKNRDMNKIMTCIFTTFFN